MQINLSNRKGLPKRFKWKTRSIRIPYACFCVNAQGPVLQLVPTTPPARLVFCAHDENVIPVISVVS